MENKKIGKHYEFTFKLHYISTQKNYKRYEEMDKKIMNFI